MQQNASMVEQIKNYLPDESYEWAKAWIDDMCRADVAAETLMKELRENSQKKKIENENAKTADRTYEK